MVLRNLALEMRIFPRKFFRKLVAILEHIKNSTQYKLYANDRPKGPTLLNRGSELGAIILIFFNYNDPNAIYILC